MEGYTKETIIDQITVLDHRGFPQIAAYALIYWMPKEIVDRIDGCIPDDLKITANGCKYHVIEKGEKNESICLVHDIYDKIRKRQIAILKKIKMFNVT